ncbi:MAG: AAA family ATPase [Mycobacterium leprae]
MALEAIERLRRNIGQVYIGRPETVDLLLVAVLAQGHLLLDDVPGIGKTTLLKSLARSLSLTFGRVQCTPDLLPTDITGLSYYDQEAGAFRFRPGPVLNHVVLVDEINRTTPRTQSALLEAMEERQVTVDGQTHPCADPFLVLATQNPIELEGTFPLPEAQLDRFLMRLHLGYPEEQDEAEIVRRHAVARPLADLQPVLTAAELMALRSQAAAVRVSEPVLAYMVALVRATRTVEGIRLGASPRADLALYRASQALALLQDRAYVLPDDVKRLAEPVLAHRLILTGNARLRGETPELAVAQLLERVPVPAEPLPEEG